MSGGIDSATHIPVYSLYGATVLEPPDSLLVGLDALVIDLQDVGTRTWTYVASMLYAMRAAARHDLVVIVLDRPNPVTGSHVDGPLLDSALAYAGPGAPGRPARPYALAPIPLRHGLTMGELARYYNDAMGIHSRLHVMPARGWRRVVWFEETGLPWVRPSPNLPDLTSVLTYPALVAFEGTNISVGRGTPEAFEQLGAPWLDGRRVTDLLAARRLDGVRFEATTFTPSHPGDGKYADRSVSGVRIVVTNRSLLDTGRLAASLLWAIAKVGRDSLRVDTLAFDLRLGSPAARHALVNGGDPDSVADAWRPGVAAFSAAVGSYLLYDKALPPAHRE